MFPENHKKTVACGCLNDGECEADELNQGCRPNKRGLVVVVSGRALEGIGAVFVVGSNNRIQQVGQEGAYKSGR